MFVGSEGRRERRERRRRGVNLEREWTAVGNF